MKRLIAPLSLLILLSAGLPVRAEWVTERLYLGLYPQPDTSTTPLKMVPTGEEVEILQRQGDFVQLQLNDGTQGWARAEFIAEQPPATVRIDEVIAERDRARQQLEQTRVSEQQVNTLQQKLAQANSTVARLRKQLESEQQETAREASEAVEDKQQRIAKLQADLDAAREQVATLEADNRSLHKRIERSDKRSDNMLLKIVWGLGSMLVTLIIGVLIGARWMAARIRRRFNGLKVW